MIHFYWKMICGFWSDEIVPFFPIEKQKVIKNRWTGTEILLVNDERYHRSYVLVRQSENNFIDWFFNLLVFPWRYNASWYHLGFLLKALSVRKEVMKSVIYWEAVTFFGLSQGGATAAILAETRPITSEVITFGCPKYSSNGRSKNKITNYINGNDLITQLPFWFRRPGEDIYLKPKTKGWSWKNHHSYGESIKNFA